MAVQRKRIKRVPKVHATGSVYIDPLGCDSTISYKVVSNRHLHGTVQLADCNRKIEWYFANSKDALAKIDKAIEALQTFRAEFAKAQVSAKPKRKKKVSA